MANAKLPPTQAATLIEIKRIERSDEPAYRYGEKRGPININALNALLRKGYVKFVTIEVGPERCEQTFVFSTDEG